MPFSSTECIQGRIGNDKSILAPMYLTNTYLQDNNDASIYSRFYNPNASALEKTFAKIYSTENLKITHCHALSSGMSAIVPLILCLRQANQTFLGTILVDKNSYRECLTVFRDVISLFYEVIETDLYDLDETARLLREKKIDLIFVDVCPWPKYQKTDIATICELAHNGNYYTPVCVDNTNLSCWAYNPFEDDADIVIESLTKYCCGHGDITGGVLLNRDCDSFINLLGCRMTAHDAWMLSRSMSTMDIRMEKIVLNTNAAYETLKELRPQAEIHKCVGLISYKNNDIKSLKKKIGEANVFHRDYSFGSDYSNITFETEDTIRFAIGLESTDDICKDLRVLLTEERENEQVS